MTKPMCDEKLTVSVWTGSEQEAIGRQEAAEHCGMEGPEYRSMLPALHRYLTFKYTYSISANDKSVLLISYDPTCRSRDLKLGPEPQVENLVPLFQIAVNMYVCVFSSDQSDQLPHSKLPDTSGAKFSWFSYRATKPRPFRYPPWEGEGLPLYWGLRRTALII